MKPADLPTDALPPELAQLAASAQAADAALDLAAAPPGDPNAPEPPPPVDPADELTAMLQLAVTVAGHALPPIPRAYTPDACRSIAVEYLACADKYGWTWHQNAGGPELRLALAIGLPGMACVPECRRYLAEQRAARAAAAGAAVASGQQLQPVVVG